MMNQPQLNKVRCVNCNFETYKCDAGVGSFVLTCTNCATKYILAIALGTIQAPKVDTNVKQ